MKLSTYIKEDIKKKIHEISKILLDKDIVNKNDLSFFSGQLGISLFHFYYSKLFHNNNNYNFAYNILELVIKKGNNEYLYNTFSNGFAGLGWFVEFLNQNDFVDVNTNDAIGDLDDFLFEYMKNELKFKYYDYLHSSSGIALYFLKRKISKKRTNALSCYIELLEKASLKENDGLKWLYTIRNKDNSKKEDVYDLGTAHGISSLIFILSKIFKTGINRKKTNFLLNGAVNFLLSKEQNINKYYSYFPRWVSAENHTPSTSRLAWCYGDLGISISLWYASQATGNKNWMNKALEILKYSTKRKDLQKNNIVDAGLCHGTAGVAHIYRRMYMNTNIIEFKDASNYWYSETLKMAKYNIPSGFLAYRPIENGGLKKEFGFLDGIAGIGLSLISAISNIDPAWDEALLLS